MEATWSLARTSEKQYSLIKILLIWGTVTVPMLLLAWVVGPALYPSIPIHPGLVYWMLMIVGMIWQFVVSLFILREELSSLCWESIKQRIWLYLPRDPKTGRENARLFWWVIPCLLFSFITGMFLGDYMDGLLTWLLPSLQAPAYMDITQLIDPQYKGQWWIFGISLVSFAFNYFLGEELLFRGVLLPKMNGVFGSWDWVANAILFGLYHLHKPWNIPSIIISSLAIAWPARRFHSLWMAMIVHGAEGFFIFLVLGVILGVLS